MKCDIKPLPSGDAVGGAICVSCGKSFEDLPGIKLGCDKLETKKMGIKKQKKTVFTCSDGKEFTDEQQAKDHEFHLNCVVGDKCLNRKDLAEWLLKNRNFVLDYIGTQYDPVPVSEES